MGDNVLVCYRKTDNKFSILSSGTHEELLLVKKSIDDLLPDFVMNISEVPSGVSIKELASSNELLEKYFSYLKDYVDTDNTEEIGHQINFSNLDDGELF